ncbi:YciI family protein [Halostreptopolyspora alba]|uniref:YciI family protein n=1 Tax=Halostreptopolyspora alba TaxID=2487137 RepID=A0A3N0E622_9ACTN|nr:YciI family protein [Nocardiopsaceae bacterium YIM 96095]
MRVMMFMKATEDSEAGVMPSEEAIAEMTRFNEELVSAGVLLDGDGLHPSSKGARVRFSGGRPTVVDGPFAETKELVAGYWVLQVKSREEAIEWAKRCPAGADAEFDIEVRPVLEAEDLGPGFTPELREREERMREQEERMREGVTERHS